MDSLFDQLKSAPPVNVKSVESTKKEETIKAVKRSPSPISIKDAPKPDKVKKKKLENSTVRRESMPPPATPFVTKAINKSRSLSPPRGKNIKPLKVMLERKKMEESIDKKSQKNNKAVSSKASSKESSKASSKSSTATKRLSKDDSFVSTLKNGEKSPKKATPTKAQQKLFDPAVLVKAQQLKQQKKLKVKRCKVRVMRQDLKKLQRQFNAKNKNQKQNKQLHSKQKNKIQRGDSLSPSPTKQSAGFFIKINALAKSPKSKTKIEKIKKEKKSTQKFSVGSIARRVNAAAAISSTKPTKFTRTQLIKMYGKRVFCSRVKIERCAHPMMLIFESNARARRLQAKRSKSKNLSVSFREQVEIFGDSSDSEETDASVTFPIDIASTSQAALKSANPTVLSISATPARLKKVENGKVVDDIELDPSLFIVPTIASTPYPVSGRKKREKKSFSPLKGDGAPSPRKEQLKLANEKMPPSSLRRLTADEVDEDDDEDDECEYIVPIEIPERRTSRASSANAFDDVIVGQGSEEPQGNDLEPTPMNISDISANISSVNNSTGESFASAVEEPVDKSSSLQSKPDNDGSVENITNGGTLADSAVINEDKSSAEGANNVAAEKENADTSIPMELPKLTRIDSVSPTQSINSFNDIVDSLIKNVDDGTTTGACVTEKTVDGVAITDNGAEDNNENGKDLSGQIALGDDAKCSEGLNDDISLQMFVDDDNNVGDSSFLEDSAVKDSEIVDGIVQERIEEISKDNPMDPSNDAAINLLSSKVTAE